MHSPPGRLHPSALTPTCTPNLAQSPWFCQGTEIVDVNASVDQHALTCLLYQSKSLDPMHLSLHLSNSAHMHHMLASTSALCAGNREVVIERCSRHVTRDLMQRLEIRPKRRIKPQWHER